MSSAHEAAEAQKALGNEEFNEKNFDKAVECYSEAIRLDPENHVYYSNRSAAYGALGQWELAEADGKECVQRNAKFAKGYHRLANAQKQLGRSAEALETLKTAQSTAENPEKVPGIKKLLRQINQELAAKNAPAASASPASGGRQVPAHIAKELQELQPQFQAIKRELDQIEGKLAAYARQKKRLALVGQEVAELPEDTKTFRSVGKMFLRTDAAENAASLAGEEKKATDQMASLEARKNYLNRQKLSLEENITELLAQCST